MFGPPLIGNDRAGVHQEHTTVSRAMADVMVVGTGFRCVREERTGRAPSDLSPFPLPFSSTGYETNDPNVMSLAGMRRLHGKIS